MKKILTFIQKLTTCQLKSTASTELEKRENKVTNKG